MTLARLPQVLAMTGLSKTTLHRLEAAGRFVSRRKLSERAVGWDVAEVEAWLAARPAVVVNCADAPRNSHAKTQAHCEAVR